MAPWSAVRPMLRPKYSVEPVPGHGVFLLSETASHVLEGAHAAVLLPLLDGRRTAAEIVAALAGVLGPAEVYAALEVMRTAGHLVDGTTAASMPPEFASFWSELDVDGARLGEVVAGGIAEVSTHGDVSAGTFLSTAASFGLRTGHPGHVHVALTDDYQRPGLDRVNRSCLSRGIPLVLVKPVGIRMWIGPAVVPGRTACWDCLRRRLDGNREVENFVLRAGGRSGPLPVGRARAALLEQQACVMLLPQLLRLLANGAAPELEDRLLVTDVAAFSFESHQVVRRPQCAVCGDPSTGSSAGRPFRIGPSPATGASGSGSRGATPESTFERLGHLVSPVTGVVKQVVPSIWHGAGPLRVYVAGHNFALKNDQLAFLKDGLRTHSSGKGRSDAQARTSALCEALERFSGVHQGDEPRIRSSLDALGDDAVDPRECMLFSETQYRERDQWLARGSRFQVVPLAFDPTVEIEWTPLWSLTRSTARHLPTGYLYYNHPTPSDRFYFWADSNGAAAGASREEAVLQGLLELVERDSVAIWWYNRMSRAAVDLDAFDPDYADELRSFYKGHDREFWVLDITTDTGIPAFVAVNRRTSGPVEDIMMGFGAHLDARLALNRALTEMNQFMPALLTVDGQGRTVYGVGDHDAVTWWRTATLDGNPYLAPSAVTPRTPEDFRHRPVHDAGAAVRDVQDVLESLGHEVLVLDQTRPDVGLPVVKVVVPGLRHFWARLAPGRLFDVPARLDPDFVPLGEGDLNPVPMFL